MEGRVEGERRWGGREEEERWWEREGLMVGETGRLSELVRAAIKIL